MSTTDDQMAERVAAVSTTARARNAHNQAGIAVAAVTRGGELVSIHLGYVPDWTNPDDSDDIPGQVQHLTTRQHEPFVTYAGVWTEAKWTVEHDPDVDDVDEALQYAWEDNYEASDKYETRVNELNETALQLGFYPLWRPWEDSWANELEELWPAICEVAQTLITGQPVTHDTVLIAIARCTDGDDDDDGR